ncbi:MAG: hypothetical protein QUU85_03680, partial [Candidatus Eisenbacteria bacterium]|nr:hypothetical protein [Candidatus Eisenbacteria bacterium]
ASDVYKRQVPGMTETSLLPKGAAAVGVSFDELVERLCRRALRRRDGWRVVPANR